MPRALTALAVTAVLVGLPACGSPSPSGGDDADASPASSAAQTVDPEQTTSAPPSPAPTDAAQVIAVTVTGGRASGDTDRVVVDLGTDVRIEVTADVADEVHVHGYDLTVDTVPGQPVTVEFTADIPGVFEVELHDVRVVLTRLQVQ